MSLGSVAHRAWMTIVANADVKTTWPMTTATTPRPSWSLLKTANSASAATTSGMISRA
jgi:hypothetical protein